MTTIILNNKVKINYDTLSKTAVTNFIIGYFEGSFTFKSICTIQKEGNANYYQIDKYFDIYKVVECTEIDKHYLQMKDADIRGSIPEVVLALLSIFEKGV